MTSVVVVTSDPAITVAQDNPAITAIVPVTQFPNNKSGVSLSVPLAASTDFNTVTAAGFYYTIDVLSANAPVPAHLWYLNVDVDGGDPTFVRQIATMLDAMGVTYLRTLVGGSWGSWQQIVALDGSGRLPAVDGSQLTNVNAGVSSKILNALGGLTLSTAGGTGLFSVAAGAANDSTNATTIVLASTLAKTTNSWSVGNGNGALDTGTITNSTWYHVFLIDNPTTVTVDVLISLSATAPSLPTGYTLFRRIGSMKTDGSGHWTTFSQNGDEFLWKVPLADASAVASINGSTLVTVTVPTGVEVYVKFAFLASFGSAQVAFAVTSPDAIIAAVAIAGFYHAIVPVASAAAQAASDMTVRTNTSAQINVSGNSTGAAYYVGTYGWIDRRGKL